MRFGCNKCNKDFSTKHQLLEHIKIVHEKRYLVCNNCGMEFKSRTPFRRHIKGYMVNGVRKPPGCKKIPFTVDPLIDNIIEKNNGTTANIPVNSESSSITSTKEIDRNLNNTNNSPIIQSSSQINNNTKLDQKESAICCGEKFIELATDVMQYKSILN